MAVQRAFVNGLLEEDAFGASYIYDVTFL